MINLNHNIIFDYIYILIFIIIITPLIIIINKKNIFTFYVYDKVQNTNGHKASLLGGILLFTYLLIFFKLDIIFTFFLVVITFTGFLSDSKFLENSKIRLLLLFLSTLIYIYMSSGLINTTGFDKLDLVLNYKIFNILFTGFCITLIINGCNFIDGINNNLNFYFIKILIVLIFTVRGIPLNFENIILLDNLTKLMAFMFFLAVINYFSIIFNGDSGAYLIGTFISVLTISIVNNNIEIEPMFACCIFAYPAIEVLFSILRKKIEKNTCDNFGPLQADDMHIHMILLRYLKKKFSLNINNSHFLTSLIISICNGAYLLLIFLNRDNFLNLNICFYVYLILYFFIYLIMLKGSKN